MSCDRHETQAKHLHLPSPVMPWLEGAGTRDLEARINI